MSEKLSLKPKILNVFPAFRHKNYRYYFSGQLVSLIGTWLQAVAQGWYVLELTHSAFMVGLVAALGFLPVMIFGLLGGVIVDRFHKRKLLIFTQIASLILALSLGSLSLLGYGNVWMVSIFAFLLGIVNAIDMPARQSFTIELVGSKDLPSAIALNMSSFNTARVIGPALAGLLIATIGTSWAFILNGLSFLGPLFALMLMNVQSDIPKVHAHPLRSIKIGLKYAFTHPSIKNLLIFTSVISIFGFSYTTLLPVIIQQTFNRDATGLGIVYTAVGIGAIISAFITARLYKDVGFYKIIFWGSILFSISILLLSFVYNFYLSLPFFFFAGTGFATIISTVNSTIQRNVEDSLRGRVMSIFTLSFIGMQPIGSFLMGFFAEHFGSQFALRLGSIIVLLFSLYIYTRLLKNNSSPAPTPKLNI